MKQRIRNVIAKGKTKQALQELLAITDQLKDKDFHQEVIMQSARFETYSKAQRLGTNTVQDQGISISKINQALLDIIDQIPNNNNDDTNAEISSGQAPIMKWKQLILTIVLLIAIPVGIIGISSHGIKNLFMEKSIDSFNLTVLVHGKNGKDHRILKNQGKVALDIGTARQEASINEKGEATFKELPAVFLNQKALISIEHPQPYFPKDRNVEYVLKKNKPVYLEVELKGTDKIQGRIIDFQTDYPLDSVRVSYQNVATFSDKYGWYELNIPVDKQSKFIRVNFFKQGYTTEDIDSIAPHIKQDVSILLKKL